MGRLLLSAALLASLVLNGSETAAQTDNLSLREEHKPQQTIPLSGPESEAGQAVGNELSRNLAELRR